MDVRSPGFVAVVMTLVLAGPPAGGGPAVRIPPGKLRETIRGVLKPKP